MNCILTYNISNEEIRKAFEIFVNDNFPDSTKEESNQTTIYGDFKDKLNNIIEVISKFIKINNQKLDGFITIYYPVQIDNHPDIQKIELFVKKALNEEYQRMRILSFLEFSK